MFITLEGPDGSGKTTAMKRLVSELERRGIAVVATREPGGTFISDQVRQVLMSMDNRSMYPRTEILLFCAARAQLVEELIRPALAEGKLVISDRYADSTLAYQGYGHGFPLDTLRGLLEFATGGLQPDRTILFDIESEQGLSRRKDGHADWNRMDDYELAFHRRVRHGYLELAALEPDRWQVIDACCSPEDVYNELLRAVLALL